MEKFQKTDDMRDQIILLLFTCLTLVSCSREYEPIAYGEEACAHCRMTIVDDRFAAEIVDEKGKVFKFDDIQCMKQYITENKKEGKNLLFVEDYLKKNNSAIDATNAIYLQHEFFASPMNGNNAAFESEKDALHLKDSLGIAPIAWNNLK
jgi:copper chaperone NosL